MRHGLQEPNFRRFEQAIKTACQNYPKPTELLGELAKETNAARCRDAIKSLKDNHWAIDWEATNLDLLCVYQRGDRVLLGPKEKPDAASVTTIGGADSALTIKSFCYSDLEAYCWLITRGHLTGPILFTYTEAISQFPELQNKFNITIITEPTHYILV